MGQGHIIALAGAPILDSEGLRILAHWNQDLRDAEFATSYDWRVHKKLRASPMPGKDAMAFMEVPAAMTAQRHRVNLCYANGPVQVWQMEEPVALDDLEQVFGSGPFTLAETSDPNDIRKVHGAARALLNATRHHLSLQTREELEFLAQRTAHQIEARKW